MEELFGIFSSSGDYLAGHQCKYEYWHGLHDYDHHSDEYLIEPFNKLDNRVSLGRGDGYKYNPKEDRKKDDLQHGLRIQRLKDVTRDDIYQGLQWSIVFRIRRFFQFILEFAGNDFRLHLITDLRNYFTVLWVIDEIDIIQNLYVIGISPEFISDSVTGQQIF